VGISGSTSSGWAALRRPALRAGLHVVRRDDGHLQIGLDDPDRLVLPDRPGLYQALTALDRPPAAQVRDVVDGLVAQGWIVDAAGEAESRRTAAARRGPVAVTVDPGLDEIVARACGAASLRVDAGARLRLVMTFGEPRRALADALMREDVPHLWVAVYPRRVRLGPFVEPGRSACLRCVDAHLGERDARRATVLHQLDELPRAPDVVPDPSLVTLAAAWAARDVVRRLDGAVPALHSADVTITDALEVSRREWLRHPHCGCAWDAVGERIPNRVLTGN
jgi:bacteriocin biosynthesis cyclodehydratase domain-containing protein